MTATPAPGRLAAGHPLALLLAPLAGAALPLAYAPFDLWPLALLLPALLLWLLDGERAGRAALLGLLFGLGAFGVGIWWIYVSLHTYGNAPPAFAALATALVVLTMAAYPAAFAALLARLAPAPGARRWLLAAPALWTLLEWVRSWALSGFPWLALGYSQIDTPLAGFAPLVGVFGVGWAAMLLAGLLRLAAQRLRPGGGPRRGGGFALLAAAAVLALGAGLGRLEWTRPDGPPLRVALAQGNISQELKWRPEKLAETLERYAELTREAGPQDVIIWPETAIPIFFEELEDGFVADLRAYAAASGTDFLVGTPAGSRRDRVYRNAVAAIGRSPGFYYKQRLLPFGEYLPLRGLFAIFRDLVEIPMADFTAGDTDQPLLRVAGRPVGVSICFEAVFGADVRRTLPEAAFLVNVSNDAWFGDSIAPHQHLQIARMRALETGRALARATNTGITALVGADGRIEARAPAFVPALLRGSVQPRRGATPYVRIGDGPVALAAGLVLGLAAFTRRRRP